VGSLEGKIHKLERTMPLTKETGEGERLGHQALKKLWEKNNKAKDRKPKKTHRQ